MKPILRPGPAAAPWVALGLAVLLVLLAVLALGPMGLLGLAGLGVLAGWGVLCWRAPHLALLIILALITFSSHAFALAHTGGVPSAPLRAGLAAKDVLAWTLLLVLVLRAVATRTRIAPALFVVGALVLIGGFLVLGASPAPPRVQFESVRGALVPIVSLGCAAFLSRRERERTALGAVYLATAAALYALVEIVLPRSFLTGVIGVGHFWTDVKQVPLFIDPLTDLPYNFSVTSGFPRLTGTFGDPLSAGTILGVCLVLALAYRRRLRLPIVCAAVLIVALLLTFTRAGWLLAFFGVAVLVVALVGPARALVVSLGGGVLLTIAGVTVTPLRTYLEGVFGGSDSSTLAHQQALAASARLSFGPWGSGWGTGGSVAQNSYADAVSAESTYVALLTQIGIIGTMLLAVVVIGLAACGLRREPTASVGGMLLVVLALNGIVSENMLTFNGSFPVFVAAVLLTAAPAAFRPAGQREAPAPRRVVATPVEQLTERGLVHS